MFYTAEANRPNSAGKVKVALMNDAVLVRGRRDRALRHPMPTIEHRYLAIFSHARSTIRRTLKAYAEGIAEARRLARLYDELAAMTDTELHDIGISRADIPALISSTYRGRPLAVPASAVTGRRQRSPSSDRRDQPCDQGACP